ncbi:MAG: DUF3793 family protein [Deltaproteobacteria bacterium]|jgi:hypothetical protein|nr:DUF3793 family protein [Deltaproteobacteria bacterium]
MNNHWTKLTHRYPDEKECLASFIAWQAAEVVAGVKPANLINILDRELACGRNMFTLWGKHKVSVLMEGNLRGLDLKWKGDRLLVFIYSPTALEKILKRTPVKKALCQLGYDYDNVDEALWHLQKRMQGIDFPHEIGFFLGYPVKDVYGFMGLCDLPVVGNGTWKMYGKLESSLAVLNQHIAAREIVIDALCTGKNPLSLIKKRPDFHQAA